MRISVPAFHDGRYRNDLASNFALEHFIEVLSEPDREEYENFVLQFSRYLPLQGQKSEDEVVQAVLKALTHSGWNAVDCRSTFIPGTSLKPDMWLGLRVVYVEALKLKTGVSEDWIKHCERSVTYAKHASSQITFCTDGRRFFVVSLVDGELKTASIDLKSFQHNAEARYLPLMLWKKGPLFSTSQYQSLTQWTEIGKKQFKKHVLKFAVTLPDNYKELFGLIACGAYAHYNSIRTIDTTTLREAVYAFESDHDSVGMQLAAKFIDGLCDLNFPGLSSVARRVRPLVGKDEQIDVSICKAILVDGDDRPLSWENFNSDDLSEIYETLLHKERQRGGIYATPRDLCYQVVRQQLQNLLDESRYTSLALVDPCCGSGSFLDQAIRYVGEEMLPPGALERANRSDQLHFYFIGQDIQDLAIAIGIVNVYVACARYLWHLNAIKVDIFLSTGNTMDGRSPIFRRLDRLSPDFTAVFGNPPFVKSRSGMRKGTSVTGNILYHITEKSMGLCRPGSLAFVLPAHVKGSAASAIFDTNSKRHLLRLRHLWHLPETKLFRGCVESRHVVAFWLPDDRKDAKLLILTPPPEHEELGLRKSLMCSLSRPDLQFKSEAINLADIPVYASYFVASEVRVALSSLPTILKFKKKKMVTVVQGVMEAHPVVPAVYDRSGNITPTGEVSTKLHFVPGSGIFVLSLEELKRFKLSPPRALTSLEESHMLPHAKSAPKTNTLFYPLQTDTILFCNAEIAAVNEEDIAEILPHFYSWLVKYKDLLLVDGDRKNGGLKWWQLHRACDPKPSAKVKPGIDFKKEKILVSQFLSGPHWAWIDIFGHVAAGSGFNAISTFPGSNEAQNLRKDWTLLLAAWMNSYLIRNIWLTMLGNCKLRGIGGEVLISHLLNIPVPDGIFVESENPAVENAVRKLSAIARVTSQSYSLESMQRIDECAWTLLQLSTGIEIGRVQSRAAVALRLRPTAS